MEDAVIAKLKRLLNGIEQAGVLGARCQSLELENAELKTRNTALWDSYTKEANKVATVIAEKDKLAAKVREQTEADLVLTSLKIIDGVSRGGKTREEVQPLAYLQQQQMATLQNVSSSGYSYGGLGGILGGINLR